MTEIEHLEAIQEGMAGYIRFLLVERLEKDQHLERLKRLLDTARAFHGNPLLEEKAEHARWEEWKGQVIMAIDLWRNAK